MILEPVRALKERPPEVPLLTVSLPVSPVEMILEPVRALKGPDLKTRHYNSPAAEVEMILEPVRALKG